VYHQFVNVVWAGSSWRSWLAVLELTCLGLGKEALRAVATRAHAGMSRRVDGGWPCGDENAVALGVRAQGGGHGVWRGGGGTCSGQGAGVVTSWLVWKEHGTGSGGARARQRHL
jgi:hypothetical protein